MAGILSQASKCLYCVWPALVGGIGWWWGRIIEHKTYYGALTVGVDPVSPQGQEEFNTRRQRDAEKRHTIYWTLGIIIVGYLIALLWNTLTIQTKAAPVVTFTSSPSPSWTPRLLPFTSFPSPSPLSLTGTVTFGPTTATQTPTPRVVYVAGPQVTVIVTRIVTQIVTRIVTVTPTPSPSQTVTWTPTCTFTSTPRPSETATPTPTPTGIFTLTPTPSETFTETPTLTPTVEAKEMITPEPTPELFYE